MGLDVPSNEAKTLGMIAQLAVASSALQYRMSRMGESLPQNIGQIIDASLRRIATTFGVNVSEVTMPFMNGKIEELRESLPN